MIFVVDIDDTICVSPADHDYNFCVPLFDRIARINNLYDEGHVIHYWTARGQSSGIDWSEFTHNQLVSWGCKFHLLKMNKPSYDVWIDDKAIGLKEFFQ